MNTSATPAVAFTAAIHNPLNESVSASFLFNLPLGMEPNTQRVESQMASPIIPISPSSSLGQHLATSHLDCFNFCSNLNSCLSWSYDPINQACSIFEDVRLNGHRDGSYSGIKVAKFAICCAYHKHKNSLCFNFHGNLYKLYIEAPCLNVNIKCFVDDIPKYDISVLPSLIPRLVCSLGMRLCTPQQLIHSINDWTFQ